MARLLARIVLAAFVAYLVLPLAATGPHARATTWPSTGPRRFAVRLARDRLRDLGRG